MVIESNARSITKIIVRHISSWFEAIKRAISSIYSGVIR